jgi:hypothetical protein
MDNILFIRQIGSTELLWLLILSAAENRSDNHLWILHQSILGTLGLSTILPRQKLTRAL